VSRELSALLDVEDPIAVPYQLACLRLVRTGSCARLRTTGAIGQRHVELERPRWQAHYRGSRALRRRFELNVDGRW
jgi:hypothetical protein